MGLGYNRHHLFYKYLALAELLWIYFFRAGFLI